MFFHRQKSPPFVIVGLGNPGAKYDKTRHNVGFWTLDALEQLLPPAKPGKIPGGQAWRTNGPAGDVYLLRPDTFMNNSGACVAPFLRKKGIDLARLCVICDDVDLPCGKLRIRQSGGAGTHNGLRSLVQHLGGGQWARVRLGVGAPPPGMDLADYVLSSPPPDQRTQIQAAAQTAADALQMWISGETLEKVMTRFNGANIN